MRVATAAQLDQLFGNSIQTIYWLDVKTNGIVALKRKKSNLFAQFLNAGSSSYDLLKIS